jgi:glycosyltransferase involved in cell wall biosynthesis
MRLLMITSGYPPFRSAGLERGCQRLAEALAARGDHVEVLTLAGGDPPAKPDSIPVHRVLKPWNLGPLWGLSYMVQIRRWLASRRDSFDFILCQKLWLHSSAVAGLPVPSATLLVNAGSFSDIATLRSLRGGDLLLRRALKQRGFFALSAASRAELLALGVGDSRIQPYCYMVDTERFAPLPGVDHHPDEFLFLGRFHEQKNLPVLIESFEKAWIQRPTMRLRLVGKGPEEGALRVRVKSSPAKDSIVIENWTEDPAHAYRRARAVVMTSHAEGLSNVSVEAIACGTPVVITDVSGARDVFDPTGVAPASLPAGSPWRGSGGLILPLGDVVACTRALVELHADDSLRSALSAEGRRRALDAYTEEQCVVLFRRGMEAILS